MKLKTLSEYIKELQVVEKKHPDISVKTFIGECPDETAEDILMYVKIDFIEQEKPEEQKLVVVQ